MPQHFTLGQSGARQVGHNTGTIPPLIDIQRIQKQIYKRSANTYLLRNRSYTFQLTSSSIPKSIHHKRTGYRPLVCIPRLGPNDHCKPGAEMNLAASLPKLPALLSILAGSALATGCTSEVVKEVPVEQTVVVTPTSLSPTPTPTPGPKIRNSELEGALPTATPNRWKNKHQAHGQLRRRRQ